MPDPSFLLAIPVYNEAGHLDSVLREAQTYVGDILVVDDGSTDGTGRLLDGCVGLRLIRHPRNLGYGRSLADAFAYARAEGFDWLITMDCDEQHEAAFVPAFQDAARADEVDLVSGSRYLAAMPGNTPAPMDRRQINARITELLNQRLGLGITDAFCGFKAYRVAALADLCITEPGYAMPLQLWVQAARAGWRVSEIAVPRIYHDPNRHFGGPLDDPAHRYDHYLAVLEGELARPPGQRATVSTGEDFRAAS
jgi:dolichol-phosphate mannosyltransferase